MIDTKKPSQIDRFKEVARELGCDEDEAAFDERLKGIVEPRSKESQAGVEEK